MAPRVPSLNPGINVFTLPLSTKEGFVLSRVDGAASVEDISIMVGIGIDDLLAMLDRLAELGAVKLSWRPEKPRPVAPQAARTTGSDGNANRVKGAAVVARVLAEYDKARFHPRDLDEKADISPEVKRRILTAHAAMEGRDFYQLLGVPRDADKKDIRAAYFELSKIFHPDSLFGKELGSFKTKMEAVFKRLTEAYEALGRHQKRKEYDEYLAATEQTSALRKTLDRVPAVVIEETTRRGPVSASEPSFAPATPPKSAPSSPAPSNPAPSTHARKAVMPPPSDEASAAAFVSLRPPLAPDERRAAVRERLRRNLPGMAAAAAPVVTAPVRPSSSVPPSGDARERRDSAIDGLRQSLRAAATVTSGNDPVMQHLKAAKDAELAGDLLGAASALQAGLLLQPARREIQEQYDRVSKAVVRSLAANYEKQARYEEKIGKWLAAASSWERVSEGRPEDANAARCAAEALIKAGGDLHKAQRYAQRAVDLEPKVAANVVVLARVFLAAGLRLNARRELEKAVKLDPRDEMIKNLLSEAR